ncbi:Ribosome production factor 1 [Chlorella sorokiniana]|uniref:Ribosome production factor 1 n=1 Tax=Chlorella sorokiniana TaxID=3076 RepID=A0A2P6TGE1_CHLSO|nr:Ribosome production factor 1 [Chlorella sorokiniana]|eukprot:PRW33197.1 Ribosome production factor 1 [Chlorella sorokiniana]
MGKRQRDDDDDGPPTIGPDATIGQKTSFIKNKIVRSEKYNKLRHEAKRDKKKARKARQKEEARAEELGIEPPPKAVPKTIENQRVKDETMVQPDDAEVAADEDQDEFAEHFKRVRPPHVLITTSYKVTGIMYKFISELLEVLPCATYYKRQGYPLKKIVEYAKNREFTDLMVFNEDRKQINGLLLVHLPDGPTAQFRLSNLVLSADIKNHGRATSHRPELVLNNFDTRLGHRVGRMFASLFHQDPTFKGRRVVTFHNQRDFIFFRHHRYIFEEKEKKEKGKKEKTKVVKARLQEIGPRFTLKLQSLQKGTFDSKGGEFEWVHKPETETTRKKMQLEVLLLSTSDLAAVDLPCRLLAASAENLAALKSVCTALPRLLATPREDVRPRDVVLAELLNRRPPAAWLAASHDGSGQGCELIQLARDCVTLDTVLVACGSTFDLVLVPRPAAAQDGVAFAVFATRIDGVSFIAQTMAARQVAVVLDLDATLLESEHLPVEPAGWDKLAWEPVSLTQQPGGQHVMGRISRLPNEPHHAETVHAATWVWKGAAHNYRVRQRLGWSHLRDVLIQEGQPGGKLATYVLSLGRPLYIQTAWQILDPTGGIIARHEFGRKINSARPDGVYWCPEKTPCIGVGLRTIFDQDFNMRLGPVWIADDLPEVYPDKYRDAIYAVDAYKPVCAQPNDYDADGSVLRSMADSLLRFWHHCYGKDGQGGAVGAVTAAAQQALHQIAAVPLPAAQGGSTLWCEGLFRGREEISSAFAVASFLRAQQAVEPAVDMEAAVPEAQPEAAVPENDENQGAPPAKASPAKVPPASPEDRAPLRPSSRQDTSSHAPASGGKPVSPRPAGSVPRSPGAAAAAPADSRCQAAPAAEGSVEDAVASISIVPSSQEEGASRLVLLLGNAPRLPPPPPPPSAVQVAMVVEAALGAVEVAVLAAGPEGSGEVGWAAAAGEAEGRVEEAVPMRSGSSEVEDAEAPLEGAVAEAEDAEESGPAGRKRDFAAIAGQDTLLGPGAPVFVAAAGN